MRRSLQGFTWATLLVALVFAGRIPAYAQGGAATTTLSGVVTDTSGGVLPGTTIEAKENATGVTYTAVADGEGRYTIPKIAPGTYTVKVSLQGFKTFVAPDVKILTATPASLQAKLEVGALSENVVVTSASDVVQTQTATVSSTIPVDSIQKMPVITHTALDAVVFSAGVETVGSNTRGSTINGLPTTAINITLDGINAQDKRGNEGFFMLIRPMMDSVEEITVSTSTLGADSSGAGGATIRMQTRSGTNRFSGSAYNTWRNQAGTTPGDALSRNKHPSWLWRMNTPYWFNKRDLPKTAAGDYFINDVRLQTPGFRVGGPVQKDKVFYFFNYEEFQLPESRSRTRTLFSTAAQAGNFTYTRADNGATQTINLLAIAGSLGLTSTTDPVIAKLLADIRTATGTTGRVRSFDLNLDQYDFAPSATQLRRFPTVKADYNLTPTQRLSGTYRFNKFNSNPDFLNNAEAPFPGFAQKGTQISGRYSYQVNLNSVFGRWVNEVQYGIENVTGKGTNFNGNITPETYNCQNPGCQSVGGKGYSIPVPSSNNSPFPFGTANVTSWGARNPSADVAAQYIFTETLTHVAGSHSLAMGGSLTRVIYRQFADTVHEGTITLGMSSNDPASAAFDASTGTTVYPGGINTTQAGYAKNLYALLTGRVTSFGGNYVLQPDGTFLFNGPTIGDARRDTIGAYVNDTWRAKPNLTLTLGLRYQLERPITTKGLYTLPEDWRQVYGITGAGDGYLSSGNLYHPGLMTGTNNIGVVRYTPGRQAYKTDYNNFAPSIQAAWRPKLRTRALTWLLSDDPVFRGGYSLTFDVLGTNTFTDNYGGNIGRTRSGTRNSTSGTPALGFDGWPVLMRDTARLFPSLTPAQLGDNFRLTPAVNESIDIHHPDWKTPTIDQYSAGVQRQLGRDVGIEVRYVGNITKGGWTTWDMNATPQWSIVENGFYDEFRKAQANLRANIIAGRGNTFAFTGAPGTSPLPIFMAYLQGIPLKDGRNQDPASYTASQFSNSNWYNNLSMYNPGLTGIAGTGTNGLQNGLGLGTGLDVNRQAAGLPANFFMANPALAQANAFLEVNGGNRKFNAMQVDVTKRLSHGFLVQTNYAYAFGRKTWNQFSLRRDWSYIDSGAGSDHTFKANILYELPFGRGKAFGTGAGKWMNGAIGGWELSSLTRWQSGPKFNYGNFRLVGMTEKDLQKMFKFYHRTDANGIERIYMLPEDVIANSTLALFTQSATTASGYAGELPTGRYLAPANGPDCVTYAELRCPGTAITRFITGPSYFKSDLSVVKRITFSRRMNIEARMDIFNVLNTINFTPTNRTGSNATTGWDVQSAATDINASQDPGGRITQFGLRWVF